MKAKPEDRTIIERVTNEVNALVYVSFNKFRLPTVVLLCSCSFVFVVGCASDETKARRLSEQAVVAVQAEEFDEAVALYQEVVDLYSETAAAAEAQERITFLAGMSHAVTNFSARTARDLMVKTARAVQRYRYRRGRYPNSLDELKPAMLDESPIDPWGRPLQYDRRKNGYRLSCLGADGRQGGDGDATDFVVVNGNFVSDPSDEGPF